MGIFLLVAGFFKGEGGFVKGIHVCFNGSTDG